VFATVIIELTPKAFAIVIIDLTPKAFATVIFELTPEAFANFLTPKAFANFSPAVGAKRQPWVQSNIPVQTLKGLVLHTPNAFSVNSVLYVRDPGLSLRSNRWAEISERLRR